MNQKAAISKIKKRGVLLVFPLNNQKEPASLWSEFHPRKKMNWVWDDSAGAEVGELWWLMKKLSANPQVVYSKWYRGRATFFSPELFTALLCLSKKFFEDHSRLSRTARLILDTLESDSPLSTRELKKLCDLQGKDNARFYNRAMKELFTEFLIVGFGEVDDGAFPSLAVGSTRSLFENLVLASHQLKVKDAEKILETYMPEGSLLRKFYEREVRR